MSSNPSKASNTSPAQDPDIHFDHLAQSLQYSDQDSSGASGSYPGWQYTSNDSGHETSAIPITRFVSQDSNTAPWNSGRVQLASSSPSASRYTSGPVSTGSQPKIGRQQSSVGSHASPTDPGYFTASQADAASVYSRGSDHNQNLPGSSSSPHAASSIHPQSELPGMDVNRPTVTGSDNLQAGDTLNSDPQLPHVCNFEDCRAGFKNGSDLK